MKNLIFIFLFIIFCSSAFSQSTEKDSTNQSPVLNKINYRKYKWDIGTDLIGILDIRYNSQSKNAYSFFIRKNVNHAIRNTFQSRKVGYRLRIGIKAGNYIVNNMRSNSIQSNYQNNNTYIYIRPGYEWQKQWEQFQFIYGIDIQFGYTINNNKYSSSNYNEKNQTFETGLFAFTGIKYFISPRASISTEIAWYIYSSFYTKQLQAYNINHEFITWKESGNNLGSHFIGFYTLNFSFYFN